MPSANEAFGFARQGPIGRLGSAGCGTPRRFTGRSDTALRLDGRRPQARQAGRCADSPTGNGRPPAVVHAHAAPLLARHGAGMTMGK